MTTLRREMISKIFDLLELAYQDNPPTEHARDYNKEQAEKIADVLIEMRAFKGTITQEVKNNILANSDVAWSILSGQQVDEDAQNARKIEQIALSTFETDMACPKNWSWHHSGNEDKAWAVLREFVVEKYKENPNSFQEYQTWRTQPFARGAMSTLAIRRNPENFPASWSDFLANSAMYGKKKEVTIKVDKSGTPITY